MNSFVVVVVVHRLSIHLCFDVSHWLMTLIRLITSSMIDLLDWFPVFSSFGFGKRKGRETCRCDLASALVLGNDAE
jgi:hypothetical protein